VIHLLEACFCPHDNIRTIAYIWFCLVVTLEKISDTFTGQGHCWRGQGHSVRSCTVLSSVARFRLRWLHLIASELFLSVQCYAWTEYKFTCVCVCESVSVTLYVNSPTGQTPQRICTVDSLKDADLRKDVPFRGSR